MLSRFFRSGLLVTIKVDGDDLLVVRANDLPFDASASAAVNRQSRLEFAVTDEPARIHHFTHEAGWAHFSVRVGPGFACQVDCVVTESPQFDPSALIEGRGSGIRFQPFLLPGAKDDNDMFAGRSLFFRGLHYSGIVTPGNVSLGCICDQCGKGFRLQSFHAGFSNVGYFYSGSGRHTLIVSDRVPGSPPALGKVDSASLAELEVKLPQAPDGTAFRYRNPFRCPHCAAAYIDFERYPEQRESEYYGNTFFGETPIRYESACPSASRS